MSTTKKRAGASKGNEPAYTRIDAENEIWAAQQVVATGAHFVTVINRAVECARLGKKFSLEVEEPKFIKKLKASHENRIARFRRKAAEGSKEANAS